MYKKIFSIFAFLLIGFMGFALAAQVDGQGNGSEVQASDAVNQQTQEQNRIQVQDGTHVGEGGQMFNVQTQANNRIKLEVGGVSAECGCEMKQEKVENETKLYVELSNGQNAEIKVMPNVASEKALEKLKLKVCSEEEGCQIELKEVGSGEEAQLAYELKTQRQSRVFGLFRAQMQVQVQVDAENGEVIKTNKPWWAFLASEPAE